MTEERYDALAVRPDDGFADRLEALLLGRLHGGVVAVRDAPDDPSDGVDAVVDIEAPVGHLARARRRTRWRTIVVAAAAVGLVGTGLALRARTGASGRSERLPSRAAALRALGPTATATGTPVVVGFLTDDEAPDTITSTAAAQAAAAYVNDHLGGIAGRPLQLLVCSTGRATDDGAGRACGRSFVDQGAVAVLQGRSVWGEVVASEASVAAVPFLAFDVVDLAARSPGSFQIVSQDAAGLAPAELARRAGVRRAAVVTTIGSPEAGYVPAAQRSYYERAGVAPTFVSVNADGGDADAVARTLVAADVDQVHLLMDDPTCAPVLRSLRRSGFTGPVYVNRGCLDSTGLDLDLSGVARVGAYPSDLQGREATLFRNVLAAYTGGGALGRFAPSGYGVVIGLARALRGLAGEVTAATVRSTIEQMAPSPLPVVDGATFRCGPKPGTVPSTDCSRTVVVVEVAGDGSPRRRRTLELDAFFTT